MVSRPRHRGAADRWRAAQESGELDGLPAGFTSADTLMSDALSRSSRPATTAISKECHMSSNNNASNANESTASSTADAATGAGANNDTGGKRTLRDRANSAGTAVREAMPTQSGLKRFAVGFGKVAGTVAVAGLAIFGGVSAYKRFVPSAG